MELPRSELQSIATTPLTLTTDGGGVAVLFRYPAVVLDLLQDRRTLRVEWHVVALILFEIVLTLFQMNFWRRY